MFQVQKLVLGTRQRIYPQINSKRNKVRKLSRQMYDVYVPACNEVPRIKKTNFVDILGFIQRTTLTFAEIQEWIKWRKITDIRDDQKFLPDRHNTLGPDLATAHFFTVRGSKVKFKGSEEWLAKDAIKSGKIPSKFLPHFTVEGVDASETNLCYEGFDNLIDLFGIKELILRNCRYIDDFALSRMYLMQHSLEVLDISGCHNVTERGISTLHVLKNLKKLILHDLPLVSHKELTCLLLQDILPKCEIEGVDYDNPGLLRRLKDYM